MAIEADAQTIIDYRTTRDELYASELDLAIIDQQIADLQEKRQLVAKEVGELTARLAFAEPEMIEAKTKVLRAQGLANGFRVQR